MNPALLVGFGGALGAIARHAVYQSVGRDANIPRGTLTVNVLGSFVLAAVTLLQPSESVSLFIGIGACGAFTTFSSFSFETFALLERGEFRQAMANGALNLAGALAAVGAAALLVG